MNAQEKDRLLQLKSAYERAQTAYEVAAKAYGEANDAYTAALMHPIWKNK